MACRQRDQRKSLLLLAAQIPQGNLWAGITASTVPAEVSFAEISVPASIAVKHEAADHTVAVIRADGITLEVSGDISEPLLRTLQQEVLHA